MRPSPRLSFFAAACATAMMASSAVALDFEYDMSFAGDQPVNDNVAKAWRFTNISASDGHAQINSNTDEMISTNSFAMPITNVLIQYKCSNANPPRKLHLKQVLGEEDYGDDYAFTPTTSKTWVSFPFLASDNVKGVYLYPISGQSGNWNIYHITIQTADPLPVIGAIDPQQKVGSTGDLIVHFTTSTFEGDELTFSVAAENLDNPGMVIPADSHSIGPDYSMMHPDHYEFTFHPPAGIAPCRIRFTITATGRGGPASRSFECTVVEGAVPTSPQVCSPWYSPPGVFANRTISEYVTCNEADGDIVTFTITNVSDTCHGSYSIGLHDGFFSFTPKEEDASEIPVVFKVRATDKDGSNEAYIYVVVFPVRTPPITPIDAHQTVAFGNFLTVDLEADATEYDPMQGAYIDDPLIASNITIKAGTSAPAGTHFFEDGALFFEPDAADIGHIFTFLATATDFDGTSSNEFTVTVGLEKPVLKHCPVDDWTPTSFTADIQAAVPGAATYNLRHIHHENDGTPVTNIVPVSSFPYVVSGLATTNYVYDVQAVCGAATSQWSNVESIDLHAYIAPTYAIPMTGAAHGSHTENFNCLISSGSAYWYDARTIPGWYAAYSGGSMTDIRYSASIGDKPSAEGSGDSMILSCQVDDENTDNRSLGARARADGDNISFGVVFTNQCKYAVTNITVSFTAMQFRRYIPVSHLYFSYTHSDRMIDYNDSGIIWTPVDALEFSAPKQGNSARVYPPNAPDASRNAKADIAFVGENAIQPGEVIALRWFLYAKNNWPTLGIDDLTVSWKCAWPRHTVFSVR